MNESATRPLWLLDMDGGFHAPLDASYSSAPWPDFIEVDVPRPDRSGARTLRYAPAVLDVVREAITAGVEVRWHTSWREGTVGVDQLLGLPPIDFSPLDDDAGAEWSKLREARALAGDRPLLWVDDDLPSEPAAIAWLTARQAPTTWIAPPSWMFGLRPADVVVAREWITEVCT